MNINEADVIIIDSIGILSGIYKYGDFAYIGGGFGKGIHNILEAAAFGLPVIFGYNYTKFKEAKDLIIHKGAFSVFNQQDFNDIVNEFMNDPNKIFQSGNICKEYVLYNIGATKKIMDFNL